MASETSDASDTLRVDIRHVESSLRNDICPVETTLRNDGIDETERHTHVLFQRLREDIRMIADAVAALDAKVGSLDSKVGSLDAKVGSVHAKVGSLDAKLEALWRLNQRR